MPKVKTLKRVTERPVIYPEVEIRTSYGDDAITEEEAIKLIGLTEHEPTVGADICITDPNGKKWWMLNNLSNRQIYQSQVLLLVQEILNKRFRLNGETIIIGKSGLVLNGQHTLIALIFACMLWRGEQKQHWQGIWETPPTVEKLIVFGIEETDEVINTMDTCKPRSLADVLYRSEYFKNIPVKDRKVVSRVAEGAIRTLWSRTGAGNDAFSPKKTHSELVNFLEHHRTLLQCVHHIYQENAERKISNFLTAGTASALMYLMASSLSDADKYGSADRMDRNPSEMDMDLSLLEKASEFWMLFGSGSVEMKPVREAIGMLADVDTGTGGTLYERIAIIAKAWSMFREDEPISPEGLELTYRDLEDGRRILIEHPTFDGIDLGVVEDRRNVEAEEEEISPDEIQRRMLEERMKRQNSSADFPDDEEEPTEEAPVTEKPKKKNRSKK